MIEPKKFQVVSCDVVGCEVTAQGPDLPTAQANAQAAGWILRTASDSEDRCPGHHLGMEDGWVCVEPEADLDQWRDPDDYRHFPSVATIPRASQLHDWEFITVPHESHAVRALRVYEFQPAGWKSIVQLQPDLDRFGREVCTACRDSWTGVDDCWKCDGEGSVDFDDADSCSLCFGYHSGPCYDDDEDGGEMSEPERREEFLAMAAQQAARGFARRFIRNETADLLSQHADGHLLDDEPREAPDMSDQDFFET